MGAYPHSGFFAATGPPGRVNQIPSMAILLCLTDATSHTGEVEKAMREPLHLSEPAPLPPEVKAALAYLARTPDSDVVSSWKQQLRRLKDLVLACEPTQAEWDREAPDSIRGPSSGIRSVALLHLMSQFGLGGARWMKQSYTDSTRWELFHRKAFSRRAKNGDADLIGSHLFGRSSPI